MKRLLLIDGNNMLHRSYHKHRGLQSPLGVESSAIYGYSTILASMLKRFRPDVCINIFDGGRSKHRLEILPDYKGNRVQKLDFDKDSFYSQRDDLLKLLQALNMYTVHKRGEEADDYIYFLAKKYRKGFKEIIIISNDKDFHQLINNKVSIYSPKDDMVLTKVNYKTQKGISPRQVVDYLILDGDKSDNIPGYPGVGEKTIMKFFEQYDSIRDYLASGEQFRKWDNEFLEQLYWQNKTVIDIRFFIKKFRLKLNEEEIKCVTGGVQYALISELADKYGVKTWFKSEFLNAFKKAKTGVL